MYQTILVTLDATPTDRAIIEHVKQLAGRLGSSVVLLHVATGVPAQVHGSGATGKEIEEDNAYLAQVQGEFTAAGIKSKTHLGYGDPTREIVKWIGDEGCDLVAMSTHGHRLFADMFLGATATRVQHSISIPVLLLRAK